MKETRTIQLEPCPFCGGPAGIYYSTMKVKWNDGEERGWAIVRCKDLNCIGSYLSLWDVNDEVAARKWNQRKKGERQTVEIYAPETGECVEFKPRMPEAETPVECRCGEIPEVCEHESGGWYVRCPCGDYTSRCDTREEAIEAWNKSMEEYYDANRGDFEEE